MSVGPNACYLGEGTVDKKFSFSIHAGYDPDAADSPSDESIDAMTQSLFLIPDEGIITFDPGGGDVLRWTPSSDYPADTLYFDVIRNNPDDVGGVGPTLILEDQAMSNIIDNGNAGGIAGAKPEDWSHLWVGSFSLDNALVSGTPWNAGEMYTIVVKELPTSQFHADYPGHAVSNPGGIWDATKFVSGDYNRSLIYQFKCAHDIARKMDWIRNDIENVLFPRTKRLLSLAGENLLLDKFTYDTAGNITGLRLRLFDDTTNAATATVDIADGALPEPGEIGGHYVVAQSNSLPRNTRDSHKSYASVDPTDRTTTDNIESPFVPAPGNTAADEEDETWGSHT